MNALEILAEREQFVGIWWELSLASVPLDPSLQIPRSKPPHKLDARRLPFPMNATLVILVRLANNVWTTEADKMFAFVPLVLFEISQLASAEM